MMYKCYLFAIFIIYNIKSIYTQEHYVRTGDNLVVNITDKRGDILLAYVLKDRQPDNIYFEHNKTIKLKHDNRVSFESIIGSNYTTFVFKNLNINNEGSYRVYTGSITWRNFYIIFTELRDVIYKTTPKYSNDGWDLVRILGLMKYEYDSYLECKLVRIQNPNNKVNYNFSPVLSFTNLDTNQTIIGQPILDWNDIFGNTYKFKIKIENVNTRWSVYFNGKPKSGWIVVNDIIYSDQ